MSIKHLGGCTLITRVSCSPSKIPYGGFSPVRLQTGIQRRPSPTTGLDSAKASATIPYGPKGHDVGIVIADNPVQRSLLTNGLCCPARSSLTMTKLLMFRFRNLNHYANSPPHGAIYMGSTELFSIHRKVLMS
jgi:hypothetical protein